MSRIVVVGAGPSGLALALTLYRNGIPVRLIDEKQGPSTHSKALAIHARTLELFAKLGLIDPFLEKGKKAHSITLHKDNKAYALTVEPFSDTPYPFILVLSQAETEKILAEALLKCGGSIEWNKKMVGLEGNEALLSPDERIPFDWLIGCDGGKSSVRKLLKAPFVGNELPETFLIIDVQGKSTFNDSSPHFFFSKKGVLGTFAFDPPLHRLILPLREGKVIGSTIEEIENEIRQRGCTSLHVNNLEWISNFKIHRRMVSQMRFGKCFLAGDAAHIHSPAGGQGMNMSIQDAFNLGWKLSLVTKKLAPENLLDSYEKERLPIAKRVLKNTTRITQLLTFVQRTNWFTPLLFTLKIINSLFRKKVSRALMELSYRYPIKEPLRNLFWRGPKAGRRAPDLLLEDNSHFFDTLNLQPTLLLFQENPHLKSPAYTTLILPDKNLMRTYHATPDSVYFIRPDGVIAYRRRTLHKPALLHALSPYFSSP